MIPELQQLGFTRNEANVYLTSLRLGASSVGEIAKATGLNRITVHSIIDKFERMSLMTRTYFGKRRRITAVDPSRLTMLVEEESKSIENKSNILTQIMTNLQDLYVSQKRGIDVKIFQGIDGYKAMCEDVLMEKQPMLEFADITLLEQVLGNFLHADFLPRKQKLGIPTNFLFLDSPQARLYIEKNYLKKNASPMTVKFIDRSKFPLEALFVLYGKKVSILSPYTLNGIIIQDISIHDTLAFFFQFVWNSIDEVLSNADIR